MKRKLMAKYVPFLVSENEALGSFKKWRSGLISSPSGQQMTKTLMPFWFYKIRANYVARVGFRFKTVQFSHTSDQYVDVFKYRWRVYHAQHFSNHYESEAEMRRYSSDKTWPEFAEKIAADCPDLNTESFDSDFINSFTGTIEPVRIRPMALWPEILKKLDNCERQKAEEKLKMKFKADCVELRQMELSVMAREVKMVLLPAYVIDYGSRSVGRMKAVVSGFSPQKVIGVKQHPLYKITLPALLVSTVLTFSLNALSPLNPFSITLFTMAPPLIVGWLTLLNAKRQYKKITRESTSRWNALFDAESRFFDKNLSNFNDAEAFDYFANLFTEVNRYKTYKCTRDASVQSLKHRDRAGYYQILGLVPSEKLSKTDIKLAFRAKAHKWHPDRAQDLNEAQMAEWNTKFKRILKAYQVLRNPKKRKVYDKANIL